MSFGLLGSMSLPYGGLKFEYSFKMHYYSIVCCTRLPRWQDRCYRASHELCSNYLLILIPATNRYATKPPYNKSTRSGSSGEWAWHKHRPGRGYWATGWRSQSSCAVCCLAFPTSADSSTDRPQDRRRSRADCLHATTARFTSNAADAT